MIVWVCFNSFSLILDFFDFCAPVHTLRQYRENLQILKNIAKYIDIWVISHLFRLIGGRKNWISTPRRCQNRSRIFLGWFWTPLTICEQSCFFSIFGSCFLFWLYLFSKFIPMLLFLFWSGHIGFTPPNITEKIGKNGLAHMVPKGTGTDPKPFYTNFYDSLGTC